METKKAQQRFPEKFKIEAIAQVADRERPVAVVGVRLGISGYHPDTWIKRYCIPAVQRVDLYASSPLLRYVWRCISAVVVCDSRG